jgi:hypothetical protein
MARHGAPNPHRPTRNPDGARTIFEVKTLRPDSELARVRAAISQLLEYRFFFGEPNDDLCVVTDHPAERQARTPAARLARRA